MRASSHLPLARATHPDINCADAAPKTMATSSSLVQYADAAHYDDWCRYYQRELTALWQCLHAHLRPDETLDRAAFHEWVYRHSSVERAVHW